MKNKYIAREDLRFEFLKTRFSNFDFGLFCVYKNTTWILDEDKSHRETGFKVRLVSESGSRWLELEEDLFNETFALVG